MNADWLRGGLFAMLLLSGCGLQTQEIQNDPRLKDTPASEFRAQLTMSLPGDSTPEIEKSIAIPIENAINTLPELESIRTTIHDFRCQVILKFKAGVDANDCRKALNARLQSVNESLDVPAKIELRILPPPGIPPLWACWKSAEPDQPLSATNMRMLQDRIQRLPHVEEVETFGARLTCLEVVVDPAALYHSRVSFQAIEVAIAERKGQQQKTRTNRELSDVSELEELAIKSSVDRQVFLRDVAQVRVVVQHASPVKFNGQPSFALAIRLTASARSTERRELENSLQELLPEMQQDLDMNGELSLPFSTQGADIRIDIQLPTRTSEEVKQRVVSQVVQELSPLLADCNWLLMESGEAIEIQVGQTTEPKILIQEISGRLSSIPGVKITISDLREAFPPIVVQVIGPDIDLLGRWAHSISNELRSLSGVR